MAQEPNEKPGPAEQAEIVRQEAQRLNVDSRDLPFVPSGANCLIWQSAVYQSAEQHLNWEMRLVDTDSAQRFFPLNLKPGESYFGAWYRSRLPEDREACGRVADAAVLAGRGYQQEFRCVGADGKIRWFAEDVSVEVIEPGARYRAIGVCTDIRIAATSVSTPVNWSRQSLISSSTGAMRYPIRERSRSAPSGWPLKRLYHTMRPNCAPGSICCCRSAIPGPA